MKGRAVALDGLSDAALVKAEKSAREFFTKLVSIIQRQGGQDPYIYGKETTILECSLVAFVARLDDVKRQYLVPDEVERICRPLIQGKIWQSITHGQPTWHYAT